MPERKLSASEVLEHAVRPRSIAAVDNRYFRAIKQVSASSCCVKSVRMYRLVVLSLMGESTPWSWQLGQFLRPAGSKRPPRPSSQHIGLASDGWERRRMRVVRRVGMEGFMFRGLE